MEVVACARNDALTILNFLKRNIFTRFRTPHALISDERSHFMNKVIEKLLKKYNIRHKFSAPYHPQGNGLAKVSNKEINGFCRKWLVR